MRGMKSIDHYITYSVITAQPQLTYSSVLSTIRCFPITSGRHEGQSFVQWTAHFSSDADAGMLSSLLLSPSVIPSTGSELDKQNKTDNLQVSSRMLSSSVVRLWLILPMLSRTLSEEVWTI